MYKLTNRLQCRALVWLFAFSLPLLLTGQGALDTLRLDSTEWLTRDPGASRHYHLSGPLIGDRPAGRWTFEYGDLAPAGSPRLRDYAYELPLNGRVLSVSGALSGARALGPWRQRIDSLVNSRPVAVPFTAEVTFDSSGTASQVMEITAGGTSLVGRFERDGLAQGAWVTFRTDLATETWTFEAGRLISVRVEGGGGPSVTLPVFPEAFGPSDTISLDTNYLALLRRWQAIHDRPASLAESATYELLRRQADHFQRLSEALARVNVGLVARLPVALPRYPLAPADRARLTAARIRTDALLETGRDLLANTTADPVQIENLLAPLQTFAADYDAGFLERLPRDRYLNWLWPAAEITTAGGLDEQLAATETTLRKLRAASNASLDRDKRTLVLREAERAFGNDLTSLDSFLLTYDNRTAKRLGLRHLQDLARGLDDDYNDLPDLEAREDRLPDLRRCLTDLRTLATVLTEMPEKSAEIELLYTDRVWNNFTATVMEETVKKQLIEAYTERLIPYFRDRIKTELSCDNAALIAAEIRVTHNRLIELRETDTDKLEAQLRSLDDPRAILELLNAAARR